jgi:predicted ABC-type ATPase
MNNSNLTTRLIETVNFDQNNFVKSYDKSVFSSKQKWKSSIGNVACTISLQQTTDATLQDYSIICLKNSNNKVKMLIKNQHFRLLNQGQTSEIWMAAWQKFNRTTQKQGSQVREAIQSIERQEQGFRQEKIKIKNADLQARASQKADETAQKFYMQPMEDLVEEMKQCGLQESDITLIQTHAAGIYDVTNFLQQLAILKLPEEATVIGLNHKGIVQGMSTTLKCKEYMDAYLRIFKSPLAREDFLEKLTEEPHPIIFVVPHKLFGSKRGITAQEMEWFLKNPEKMQKVYFVLRAYKTYSQKIIPFTSLKEKQVDDYKDYFVQRIFKQLEAKLELPEVKYDKTDELAKLSVAVSDFQRFKPHPFQPPVVPVIQVSELSIDDIDDVTPLKAMMPISLSTTELKILKTSRAIFLIGGMASGKGTVRKSLVERHSDRHYVIIDPDFIKESMTEYQEALKRKDENAATLVHDKSVKEATEQLKNTIEKKSSFIYDSTGSRFWIYEDQMEVAKQKGMFVELIYVETSLPNCLSRAQTRACETGRFVPEDRIRSSNSAAKDIFPDLQKLAHKWKKYNNDGVQPQLECSSKNYRLSEEK